MTCPVCYAPTDPDRGHECMEGWQAVRIAPTPSETWKPEYCRHCGRTNAYGARCECRRVVANQLGMATKPDAAIDAASSRS